MVSAFEQFIYERKKPIYGDLTIRLPRARRDRLRLRAWDFCALGIERKKRSSTITPSHARQPARAGELDRDQNAGAISRLEAVPPPAAGRLEVAARWTPGR